MIFDQELFDFSSQSTSRNVQIAGYLITKIICFDQSQMGAMRIRPFFMTATLLSPMEAIADGYHHQMGV